MPLKFEHSKESSVSTVRWKGAIDENWDDGISKLEEDLEKNVRFYFDSIDSVNSVGIRRWTNFIENLCKNHKVTYCDCPSVIVSTLNICFGFQGSATVERFKVEFECPPCGTNLSHYFNGKDSLEKINENISAVRCPSCNGAVDPTSDLDDYLEFLQPD